MKIISKTKQISNDVWQFIDTQIWEKSKTSIRDRVIMTIYIAIKRYDVDDLQTKASALTFCTLLSIIPLLALVFAVMKGFGFANILDPESFKNAIIDERTMRAIFNFIDNYLSQTKDGIFIGVGVVSLLITIWSLISSLERIFNDIWRTRSLRTYTRRFTDYFSFIFLIPFLLIVTSGISAFASSYIQDIVFFDIIISPSLCILGKILPLVTSWLLFTVVYIFIPNTKVHFPAAAISGLVAGIAFNIFQMLYISGQIWITRYNAIFGSFAILPLLMLWLQVSWLICLIGAEIACTGQNIETLKEEFRYFRGQVSDTNKEFLSLIIIHSIFRRLQMGLPPLSAQRIAFETYTPIRLVKKIIHKLQTAKIVVACQSEENSEECYIPYVDINTFTCGMFFERIGKEGNSSLFVRTNEKYRNLYNYYTRLKSSQWEQAANTLIIEIGN